MARVGGRSPWLAWPAGIVSVAVIVALLLLAIPAIPGTVSFVGDTLRAGNAAPAAAPGDQTEEESAIRGCRDLYPDALWGELIWTPKALLSQTRNPPAGSPTLTEALAPTVRYTCSWRLGQTRSISTTLADASGDAVAVAHAALTAEGFSCEAGDSRLHCSRSAGGVTEIHDLEGARWLSTVLTGWEPTDYGRQTASRAFSR